MKKTSIVVFPIILSLAFLILPENKTSAFVGPPTGCSPGATSCGGLFTVDSSRNIGFGTNSPTPQSTYDATYSGGYSASHGYIFTIASTTNPGLGIKNLTSGVMYLLSSRNMGELHLYREQPGTYTGKTIMIINPIGNIGISTSTTWGARLAIDADSPSNPGLTVRGSATASSFVGVGSSITSIDPANFIAGSVFNAGTYAVNGSFAVGTTTVTGIPAGGVFISASSTYLATRSGNVGIGTASPVNKLHLTANSSDGIRFTRTDNTWPVFINYDGAGSLQFQPSPDGTALGVGVYLKADGNVGIATTTPIYTLDVVGTGRFTQPVLVGTPTAGGHATTKTYVDSIQSGSSGVWLQSGSNLYPSSTSWNVGVGTASPAHRLDVVDTAAATTTYPLAIWNTSTATTTEPQGIGSAIKFGVADSRYAAISSVKESTWEAGWTRGVGLMFITQVAGGLRTEKMRITGAGNVGIGTSTPVQELSVVGSIAVSSNIVSGGSITGTINASQIASGIFGSVAGVGNYTMRDATGGRTVFFLDASNERVGIGSSTSLTATLSVTGSSTISNALNVGSGKFYVSGGGNVGIGTASPGQKLTISAGSIVIDETRYLFLDGGDDTAIRSPAANEIDIVTGGSSRIYVNSNGNVGVATTTPIYKLDVVGTARFTQPVVVATPTGGTHAATKAYVDSTITGGSATSSFTTITVSGTSTLVTNGTDTWSLGGKSGANIDMNGYNISGINKLTVTTIDPLYEIDGKKYSTYSPSIAGGVKEEYTGKAKLSGNKFIPFGNFSYEIDFTKIESGSDLWVWFKTVDFNKDNVQVVATSYANPTAISYKIEGQKIIFKGGRPVEFSYRLTGKRIDWQSWPTLAKDQKEKANIVIK